MQPAVPLEVGAKEASRLFPGGEPLLSKDPKSTTTTPSRFRPCPLIMHAHRQVGRRNSTNPPNKMSVRNTPHPGSSLLRWLFFFLAYFCILKLGPVPQTMKSQTVGQVAVRMPLSPPGKRGCSCSRCRPFRGVPRIVVLPALSVIAILRIFRKIRL